MPEYSGGRIVSPAWLAENLENPSVCIAEVSCLRNPNSYFEGHVPGAVFWPWMESLWHPTDRDFVTPEAFSRLMEKSGIRHETTIVLYSDDIQFATYAFWVCTMRGHSKIKILDGNREAWAKENQPFTREIPGISSSDYPVRPIEESCRIGCNAVLQGLNNPERVLLDLRSPEEFRAERVSPPWFAVDHGAVRKGRIPGAKHLFYKELLNEDQSFKPLDVLREAFQKRGATAAKEIVCYCRLSHRGSLAWFIAKYLLEFPRVRVYDGSWTEWGSMVGMPIEIGGPIEIR
jgi:thiosulfate/3-mercaptopyruvate sulfurtransferase